MCSGHPLIARSVNVASGNFGQPFGRPWPVDLPRQTKIKAVKVLVVVNCSNGRNCGPRKIHREAELVDEMSDCRAASGSGIDEPVTRPSGQFEQSSLRTLRRPPYKPAGLAD